MTVRISQTADVQQFFEKASGFDQAAGNPRMKAVVHRVLTDAIKIIEDLQITPEEFWKAVNYFNELGSRQEAGLVVAGLGLEHYLDMLMDAEDAQAGHVALVRGGAARIARGQRAGSESGGAAQGETTTGQSGGGGRRAGHRGPP